MTSLPAAASNSDCRRRSHPDCRATSERERSFPKGDSAADGRWEEQIKSPNPMTAPSVMLSTLKSWPDAQPAGAWPHADAFVGAAANPMQFWMQFAEQWQKAWTDAMGVGPSGQRRR